MLNKLAVQRAMQSFTLVWGGALWGGKWYLKKVTFDLGQAVGRGPGGGGELAVLTPAGLRALGGSQCRTMARAAALRGMSNGWVVGGVGFHHEEL